MFPTKLFIVTFADGSSERIPDKLPIETRHRADMIVEVNVATGSTFLIKNRWGPTTQPVNRDQADSVHFNSWKEMEKAGVEIWPGKAGFAQLTMNGIAATYRHSVTAPAFGGHPELLVRRTMVVTRDGRRISMPKAGGRELQLLVGREPGHSIFHMTRTGQGIESQYRAWAQAPEMGPGQVVAGAGLKFSTDEVAMIEPAKAVVGCNCDIKDLMSTGHRVGCPEKR